MNNIYDDYEKYCKSPYSRWSNVEKYNLEVGWNPLYQGRNVAQYSKSHDTVVVSETIEEQVEILDEDDGPCGTIPFRIG
jgi:hypothetical protein